MKKTRIIFLLLITAFASFAQTNVPPEEQKGTTVSKGTTNSEQIWRVMSKTSNKKSQAGFYAYVTDTMGSVFATDSAGNCYMWNYAGHFGIVDTGATYSRNSSALLQLISTTSGFLPPVMTAAQRAAIGTPAAGLTVYQSDGQPGLYVYASSAWNPISASGVISATTGITAGTTQTQGGATALTTEYNNIGTCATANDGVRLPTAVLGKKVVVRNSGATAALVYPATGGAIDGVATNGGVLLGPNQEMVYEATTATQWLSRDPAYVAVSQGTNITTAVAVTARKFVITTQSATAGAAGATPNTFSVTNAYAVGTSYPDCEIINYSGTIATNGTPLIMVDNRGTGSFDIIVSNAHGTNALSGTLVIGCEIKN
jgi:hypothetical protein